MSEPLKESVLKALQQIPGVGREIAADLWDIGVRSVHDLNEQDPAELYRALCDRKGMHVDRCMLYVFRCAVYYASNTSRNPELLKWWNWKDEDTRR
ncbi:MAG: helix-hairpin-helix domain-containing protein [Methanomicrobia archaeon]|nr:helix-hairpin-helix domain-containing protein [Methanomicrobia archaeon]